MPRELQFAPEQKLGQAMRIFCEYGYEATSMNMLVSELGINRFSVYNTFGDKQSLYRLALERYIDQTFEPWATLLQDPESGKQALFRFFEGLIVLLNSPQAYSGCFLLNAAAERGRHDAAVAELVTDAFGLVKRGLHGALIGAAVQGELQRQRDIERAAKFLFTATQGFWVQRRIDANGDGVTRNIRFLMDEINDW